MKKQILSSISLLLVLLMSLGAFAACTSEPTETEQTSGTTTESNTSSEESTTSSIETTENTSDGSESSESSEAATSSASSETDEPIQDPQLEGEFADSILYADSIKNAVQAYYMEAERENYAFYNQEMSLEYALSNSPKVTALKNTKGETYLENTMEAFIKLTDGRVFYSSDSSTAARPNIYRYGYYYYDIHFLDQNFLGNAEVLEEEAIDVKAFSEKSADVKGVKFRNGVLSMVVGGSDPYIYTSDLSFNAADFNGIEISIKSSHAAYAHLYFLAGDAKGHTEEQSVSFSLAKDNEFHTYVIDISSVPDYTNLVSKLRIDMEGVNEGETIEIKDIKAVKINDDIPKVVLDRNFHTYSDKMNQVLHFVAQETCTNIAEVGMNTAIAVDTVDKLIVKDATGIHTSLEDVDWTTAEYVGFDIKNAGVFGYILPMHENSGKLTVTIENGNYIITQSSTPANGTIEKIGNYTENDYYMGHRLYTDETHSFETFLKEAEIERNPLKSISGETYVGYDALRGAYRFDIGGTGFNTPYFSAWNRHYTADISVKGIDEDRQIYIYTVCETNSGCTEGAAILDENQMLIPIATMIFKNFGFEDEEPIYFHGDKAYSETLFPLTVKAKTKTNLTVVNTMQNWGAFPLKQVSSISYYAPYYHLSTGVTETSCISPWYVHGKSLWTLPDFRTMSGPWWFEYEGDLYDGQPQHTHAGYHYFLQYTDADGNYYASENISNVIDSSGQNYGEILMTYISDDGKIKVSYNHIEFPQTDEHRAYYEINYEVLEDVSFTSFKNDFSFFSCKPYGGTYQKMGYLDENNQIVHINTPTEGFTTLGDNCPYVSFYALKGEWENKCGNTGFVIYNSDLTVGGEKYEGNFALLSAGTQHHLTLDLEEVTLKKGDTMTINMIIIPWGSEKSTDDSNMIAIRENSCLKPLDVEVTKGEKIESVFVPKLKTDDGKTAEFTLTGGTNNVAVRVYGFDKLTAPKLYELIGGEWVEYITSSINTPDASSNAHYYDGYFVYYDGDGTYSYTFPVDMTDAESRTFRIDASEDFTEWPEIPVVEISSPLKYYADAQKFKTLIEGLAPVGDIVVSEDGSYVRIYGDGKTSESYFTCFENSDSVAVGQYLVIKYRFDASSANAEDKSDFQIFTSTVNSGANGNGDNFHIRSLSRDGKWHVAIVDMSKHDMTSFEANTTGAYVPKYVRFDIFNTVTKTESYVDIGYIGISDNLEDICKLNSDLQSGDVYEYGRITSTLDFVTGELQNKEGATTPVVAGKGEAASFIDSVSGYTASSAAYISRIDFVNGIGDGGAAYASKGAAFNTDVDILPYNAQTVEGSKLAIAGWVMVHGGIEKYVWSADGGKTWHDTTLLGRDAISPAYEGLINVANSACGKTDFGQYTANCAFQGSLNSPSGVCADLIDYVGQTVDVVFAAVPVNEPTALCIVVAVSGVEVVAE